MERRRHLGACPVEFPLSLTARHTRATHADALRTLANAFQTLANALTTIAGRRLDPWTPTFKTRTLLLRIREKKKERHAMKEESPLRPGLESCGRAQWSQDRCGMRIRCQLTSREGLGFKGQFLLPCFLQHVAKTNCGDCRVLKEATDPKQMPPSVTVRPLTPCN